MHRVTACFDEGRGPPNRQVLVERLINEFLRGDVESTLLASLEQIGNAIDAEANKNVLGEDWTLMQNYGRGFFNPESQRLEQRAKLREKE